MDNNKKITYANIIPLVGGLPLGNAMAVGHKPEYILSYKAFADNDSNLLNYWPDVPYHVLDSDDIAENTLENIRNSNVDFVTATAPCAGLSMLNTSSQRGSDAEANKWMYESARFVLGEIKPKVFWGENAPGLISKIGEGVRANLWEIAKEFGYSFSIVKTSTTMHGIPQRRVRTFYFFWDSETAPIMNYYSREMPNLAEYLEGIPEDATLQEVEDDINENIFFRWFKENYSREDIPYDNSTIIKFIDKDPEKMKSLEEYFAKNANERELKKLAHIKNKYSQGLGVWDDSPHFYTTNINAVITKNMRSAVHPTEDRYMNHRELMHLMGLPHDFNLKSTKKSVYTQNVPTFTARDWTQEVVKFIKGELELSESKYLIQDNLNQKNNTIVAAQEFETNPLF